jgi:uncharacterized phage-associated protein
MRFFFDERKAAQAAAYLIKLRGSPISLLALIKLLYLADRKALIETGAPITNDKIVCMRHGLVLSAIYDKTQGDGTDDGPWHQYIAAKEGNSVALAREPDSFDELSRYELAVLDSVHADYGVLTPSQLRNLTHDLPEYSDPGDSSVPVDPANILRLNGIPEEDVRRITAEAEESYFLDVVGTAPR